MAKAAKAPGKKGGKKGPVGKKGGGGGNGSVRQPAAMTNKASQYVIFFIKRF